MKKETKCVHSGNLTENVMGGVNTPVFTSSVFKYVDSGKQAYPRYYNTPNQEVVINKLCALEGAEDGLLFSSGMAAISTALLGLVKSGDHVVLQAEMYGGTHAFIKKQFPKFGIEYTLVGRDVESMEGAITDNTKLVYIETPTNPLLSLVDIKAVGDMAKRNSLISIIDNTFASPINQNPIALGMDVVCHSGTKYLGGHSDICCGAVVGSKKIMDAIRPTAADFGGNVNGATAALLERSMKTLELRVCRQSANALNLAEKLEALDGVGKVYYPGLESHPDHELAKGQMEGFGAMIGFELADGGVDSITFMNNLRLIAPALSLGGVESTICSPALTSHLKMAREDREKIGVTDKLLRFSVGIENVEDLLVDIVSALTN